MYMMKRGTILAFAKKYIQSYTTLNAISRKMPCRGSMIWATRSYRVISDFLL